MVPFSDTGLCQRQGNNLKYVGRLDVPMPELTPEQIKEEDRKRAWNRTYMRRKYERETKEKGVSEAVG